VHMSSRRLSAVSSRTHHSAALHHALDESPPLLPEKFCAKSSSCILKIRLSSISWVPPLAPGSWQRDMLLAQLYLFFLHNLAIEGGGWRIGRVKGKEWRKRGFVAEGGRVARASRGASDR
jgi:hypothetical protein